MFYDKDSMMEMFELSTTKKDWNHVLITSELYGEEFDSLGTREVIAMHREWKEQLRNHIGEKDAAYQINQGNVFVLVHSSNVNQFEQKIEEVKLLSNHVKGGLKSSLLFLSNEETEFLLKMS